VPFFAASEAPPSPESAKFPVFSPALMLPATSFSQSEDSPQAKLAVSGEVNRMITAAINVNPKWFWHGPDA